MADDTRSTTPVRPAAHDVARPAPCAPPSAPAFSQLVAQHQDQVTALVWRLLGWHADEVQDVVQDVFLAALQSLPRFRGEARPATWLYRIAVNECRRHRRRRILRLRLWQRREPRDAATSHPVADTETHAQVRRAVAALAPPYREVVVLRYLEGLPIEEIAAIVGHSPNAVEVRLHRAREALRETLGPLWQESP
jgi:RNA polymerase sigma-70 factor (ECF subfamily)